MRGKLGFYEAEENDFYLVSEMLELMQENGVDYTNFFRQLAGGIVLPELAGWHKKYLERLSREPDKERERKMKSVNPKYILRNYIAQSAISQAEKGNNTELLKVLEMLEKPFDEQPENAEYAANPPAYAAEIEVSCSS
jgi:uncharacterized protein YdiU (UPF0061 family)